MRTHTLQVSFLLVAIVSSPSLGQDPGGQTPHGPEAINRAIERGLEYLVSEQKADGRWESGRHLDYGFVETALCGLALLAEGSSTKDRSQAKYHKVLRKAVDFLKERIGTDGRLRDKVREKARPYNISAQETWRTSFAALFLAEVYRKDKRDDLRPKLEALKTRLEQLQRETGGYCHDLRPRVLSGPGGTLYYSEDLVVATNVVVLTLHSLEEAGIKVSSETLQRIRSYYQKVRNRDGGFKYGLKHIYLAVERSERSRSIGAVLALQLLGKSRKDKIIKDALAYVKEGFREIHQSPIHQNHVYTVNVFLAALACARLGEEDWNRFASAYFPWILRSQNEKGFFRPKKTAREGFIDTPFLLITLQLQKGHLSFATKGSGKAPND